MARYFLARALAERPGLAYGPDDPDSDGRCVRSRSWHAEDIENAYLGPPDPGCPPKLPPALAGAALILLASIDIEESRADRAGERAYFTGHSAYNVLRVVAVEPRWPADLRDAMGDVVAQRVEDPARFGRHVTALSVPQALPRQEARSDGEDAVVEQSPSTIAVDPCLLDLTDDANALRLGTHDLLYLKSDTKRRVTVTGPEGRLLLSLAKRGGVPAHVRPEARSHLRSALKRVEGKPVLLEGRGDSIRLSSRVRLSDRLKGILKDRQKR